MQSAIAYERKVCEFFAELRDFYYPMLYREEVFEQNKLIDLPQFHIDRL